MPKKNIILIEDNPIETKIVLEYFKRIDSRDYNIEHFDNLEEALNRIKTGKAAIDLILSDLTLPDSVGVDTFVTLRSKFKELPLVILTNLDDPRTATKIEELGALAYIRKSDFNSQVLESVLERVFDLSPGEKVLRSNPSKAKLLSGTSPVLYQDFLELYKGLLKNAVDKSIMTLSAEVESMFNKEREAFCMVGLSAADIKQLHEESLAGLTQVNDIKYPSTLLTELSSEVLDKFAQMIDKIKS